jgi:ornithine--oxo-acid transaminase
MAATPIGCAAALVALDVLVDERISDRANKMGKLLIDTLEAANPPQVKAFMGSGLFWGVVLNVTDKVTPRRLASLAGQRGLLVGPAGADRLRVCPPLVISEDEIIKGADILIGALRDLEAMDVLPAE